MGNPLVVARELNDGADYYLSHGTAMEIHGMVTQPRLVYHVTTLTKRRPITIMGAEFRFLASGRSSSSASRTTGSRNRNRYGSAIRADDHRCLRMPEYCGGLTELAKGIAMKREFLDSGKLVAYALQMDIGAVIRRLGYSWSFRDRFAEIKRTSPERLTDTVVRLDPLLPAGESS